MDSSGWWSWRSAAIGAVVSVAVLLAVGASVPDPYAEADAANARAEVAERRADRLEASTAGLESDVAELESLARELEAWALDWQRYAGELEVAVNQLAERRGFDACVLTAATLGGSGSVDCFGYLLDQLLAP